MPRTKDANTRIRNRRRTSIIQAAIRCFARMPYNEVTISLIAREAKCGHSLIYHYFSGIRDIHLAVYEYMFPYFEETLAFFDEPDVNPDIKFIGVISFLVDSLRESTKYAYYLQTIIQTRHLVIEFKDQFEGFAVHTRIVRLIENAQKMGRIIPMEPLRIMEHIFLVFRGIASEIIFEPKKTRYTYTASMIYLPFLVKQPDA